MNLDNNMINTFKHEELQNFLSCRKELQRELDHHDVKPAPINYHHRSPIYKAHRRSASHVPRSLSSSGQIAAKRKSMDQSQMRSRSVSSLYFPSPVFQTDLKDDTQISRKISLSQQTKTTTSPIYIDSHQHTPESMAWISPVSHTFDNYSIGQQSLSTQSLISCQDDGLNQVTRMEEPADLINQFHDPPISPLMTTSSPYATQFDQINMPIYPISSTDIFVPGASVTSMSRQQSISVGLPESIEMMRFNSWASFSEENQQNCDRILVSSQNNEESRKDSQAVNLSGGDNLSSVSILLNPCQVSPVDMIKNKSSAENSSISNRSIKRLQEQNNNACARPIMPKNDNTNSTSGGFSSTPMIPKKVLEKNAPAKTNYQRPKHDRVFCKQCDSHPEGFRGEHEFRRHQDREHKSVVRKFICVQPKDEQKRQDPILPLSQCKACSQMKKYNAYYNAAAHLRRAHFMPKPKGRSKNKLDDSKRGSKIGEWPTMAELKFWMKEVEEPAIEATIDDSKGEIDVLENRNLEPPKFEETNYVYQYPTSQITGTLNEMNSPSDPYGSKFTVNNLDFSKTGLNFNISGTHDYGAGTTSGVPFQDQISQLITNSYHTDNFVFYNDLNCGFLHDIPDLIKCPGIQH
ncbi:putative key lime pathogenicity protein [Golovinomyces cichoracearum]|uniref:Putative key lime pathogenicity protein n=1 Tax=Golovinomyces cichoracearum TaxID=62708 RepID=A0A420IUE3_9PEZI|nr:putative key lime pathogenicity protein [Golovinomyces cichoracearum]